MRKFKLWLRLALMNANELDSILDLGEELTQTRYRTLKFLALELDNYTVSEIAAHVVLWAKVKPHEMGYVMMILNTRAHRGNVTLDYAQELWEKTY